MNYRTIISKYPPVPEDRQIEMLYRNKESKDRVLLGYGKTIIKIVRKYARNEAEVEEMFQQSWLGLIHASNLFDPTRGVKPITYFTHWIKEKVRKYLQENKLIPVPNLPYKLLMQYKKLEEQGEKDPMEKMGLTKKRKELLTKALKEVKRITYKCNNKDEQKEAVISGNYNLLEELYKKEDMERYDKLIKEKLTDTEIELIELRKEGRTRKEVGQLLGMTDRQVLKKEMLIKKLLNKE